MCGGLYHRWIVERPYARRSSRRRRRSGAFAPLEDDVSETARVVRPLEGELDSLNVVNVRVGSFRWNARVHIDPDRLAPFRQVEVFLENPPPFSRGQDEARSAARLAYAELSAGE